MLWLHSGIHYATGHLFEMKAITQAAHRLVSGGYANQLEWHGLKHELQQLYLNLSCRIRLKYIY